MRRHLRVVSEADSPVQQIYVKTKDGLYVAAAMRKPKGDGPFPALIYFHGAPGGRGIEQLTGWSRGATGGPVWERFLQEGYVVVVSDNRNPSNMGRPIPGDEASFVDDAVAVLDHVRALPFVNPSRTNVYGVSLGGNVVLHLIGRTKVHAAILGAPAPISFLDVAMPSRTSTPVDPMERWKNAAINAELARKNIEPIQSPILILVGTADGLIHLDRRLYELLTQVGKPVRMEIYENGYHDFCIGPQGHAGRKGPLLDITLDALEESVKFLQDPDRSNRDAP